MLCCENEAFFIFSIESFLFGFSNMFIIKSLPSINKEDDNLSIELNDGTINLMFIVKKKLKISKKGKILY